MLNNLRVWLVYVVVGLKCFNVFGLLFDWLACRLDCRVLLYLTLQLCVCLIVCYVMSLCFDVYVQPVALNIHVYRNCDDLTVTLCQFNHNSIHA